MKRIDSSNLRVYAVWAPSLASDEERVVSEATKYLPDKRVRHFWDGDEVLKKAYSPVLGLDGPAWDVYLAYDRNATWKDAPPAPQYWMHQLRLAPGLRLDGDTFAAEINKLLGQIK